MGKARVLSKEEILRSAEAHFHMVSALLLAQCSVQYWYLFYCQYCYVVYVYCSYLRSDGYS